MPRLDRGAGDCSSDEDQVWSQQPSSASVPRPRLQPRTAQDMEVLRAFAEEVNANLLANANDRECMEMPECIMQRPSPFRRTPWSRDTRDRRFEKRDQRRSLVRRRSSDNGPAPNWCRNIVTRSSTNQGTIFSRLQCEFAGGWVDQSWKDQIPGKFQERARELGLIDATWHCTQFCGNKPTGCMSSSIQRSQAWRQKNLQKQKCPRRHR